MIKPLKEYQKSKLEKLDAVTTGVSIERRHKIFVELKRINLSALVRDVLDTLMGESESDCPDCPTSEFRLVPGEKMCDACYEKLEKKDA